MLKMLHAARYYVEVRLEMLSYCRVHSAYLGDPRLVSHVPETFSIIAGKDGNILGVIQ
jgi:hypothetical protein